MDRQVGERRTLLEVTRVDAKFTVDVGELVFRIGMDNVIPTTGTDRKVLDLLALEEEISLGEDSLVCFALGGVVESEQ